MAMQVSNQQPFEVVFTLLRHPNLGLVFEVNAIALNANGSYSLTNQKIRKQNAGYFRLSEHEKAVLNIIEEYEAEELITKFYTGKKRVRPPEFFAKHYTDEMHAKIRPYIEKRLARILELIGPHKTFANDHLNNPAGIAMQVSEEPASILFHFRRNEEGTNYFITIKHNEQRLNWTGPDCELIVAQPAWLRVRDTIIRFDRDVDGKKLLPFFTKNHIHIPKRSEPDYYKKFIVPIIERYHVYAQGFEIVTEQHDAKPVLKLMDMGEGRAYVTLNFRYGNWLFPYNTTRQVYVTMEQDGDDYRFRRIRRSRMWEEGRRTFLEDHGLEYVQGAMFSTGSTDAESAGRGLPSVISWLMRCNDDLLRDGYEIDQSQLDRKYYIGEASISLQAKENADWFDIHASVLFGKFELSFYKLRNYILKNIREFELPDGSVAIIPDEWFARLKALSELSEAHDEDIRLRKVHWMLLDELEDLRTKSEEFAKATNKPDFFKKPVSYPAPAGFTGDLRPYQQKGYSYLRYMSEIGFGACLADDMGLGKTVQAIALMCWLVNENPGRANSEQGSENAQGGNGADQIDLFTQAPLRAGQKGKQVLVVCPTSLIYNWQNEINKFAPGLKTVIYGGVNRERLIPGVKRSNVVIASYGVVRNDLDVFKQMDFSAVMLDESQFVKNPGSLTARAVIQLKSDFKMVLTGTPVENGVSDLWSQMNFVNPGLLGSYRYFSDQFIRSIERDHSEKRMNELRRLVKPFILRRTKQEVAPELPEKTEKVHYCDMTEEQERIYQEIRNQYRNELLGSFKEGGWRKSGMKLLAGLIRLRQIANHPSMTDHEYTGSSGKLEEVLRNLHNVIESGNKVLVFSQFVKHLNILRDELDEQHIPYCYLDGSIPAEERMEEVNRFQSDDKFQVFLISLKAGGTGLNLTAAGYVFMLDPWWNPAAERQAQDRTHRIGQNKNVIIYKFITKDTIEEKILKLQEKKTELAENLVQTDESFFASLTPEELDEILQ